MARGAMRSCRPVHPGAAGAGDPAGGEGGGAVRRLLAWIDGHRLELIRFAQELIRIPSVNPSVARRLPWRQAAGAGSGEGGGRAVPLALEAVWQRAEAAGMRVRRTSGQAGHVEIGRGPGLVGVLAHVDVVPPGPGWTVPPFGGEVRHGRLYGRGAVDDKGPVAAAFFAFRAIHELQLPCRRRARLILGGDEEGHWTCLDHYFQREERPQAGFSPDGLFPAVHKEKGILTVEMVLPWPDGDGFLVVGSGDGAGARHASPVARFLAPRLRDTTGQRWGVRHLDPLPGALSVRVEDLVVGGGSVRLALVVRYGKPDIGGAIRDILAAEAAQVGGRVEAAADRPPHTVPLQSPVLRTLQRVFYQQTGLAPTPLATGAGTFARYIPEGVAFGPVLPGAAGRAHQADEFIRLDHLVQCARLYAHALYELMNSENIG